MLSMAYATEKFELLDDDISNPLWFCKYMDGEPVEFDTRVAPKQKYFKVKRKRNREDTRFSYIESRTNIPKRIKINTKGRYKGQSISSYSDGKVLRPAQCDPVYYFDSVYFISGSKNLYGGIKEGLPCVWHNKKFTTLSPFWGQKEAPLTSGLAFRCSKNERYVFGWAKSKEKYLEPYLWDLKLKKVITLSEKISAALNDKMNETAENTNEQDTFKIYLRWFNGYLGDKPLQSIMKKSYAQFPRQDFLEIIITLPHFVASIYCPDEQAEMDIEIRLLPRLNHPNILSNPIQLTNFCQQEMVYTKFLFDEEGDPTGYTIFNSQNQSHYHYFFSRYGQITRDIPHNSNDNSRVIAHDKSRFYITMGNNCYLRSEKFTLKNTNDLIPECRKISNTKHRFKSIDYVSQDGKTIYGTCFVNNDQEKVSAFKLTLKKHFTDYKELEQIYDSLFSGFMGTCLAIPGSMLFYHIYMAFIA